MKAIVTGGAGFIGSHLSEILISKGMAVTILDNLSTGREENIKSINDKVKFIKCDLSKATSEWTEEIKDADYIYHLASLADIVPSIEKPCDYFDSNVVATLNVLEACREANIKKLVYAASSSCYGRSAPTPTHENERINPEYPYALTKRLGEELILHWGKVYGIPSVSTRFFNVYGTRSRTSGTYGAVFGVFLAQKLKGKPLTIVGDGTQSRDFTYVTDICEGMILAAESDYSGEVFNIGSGNTYSINKLAQLIGGECVYIPKRPGEPEVTHANIEKARSLLNYEPRVSFEDGVKKVLDNIEYWNKAPVWTVESISEATKLWFEKLNP